MIIKLEKIIFVRHGEYDCLDGKLNSKGIKAITTIAEDFFSLAQNKRVKIFSSTETRTLDSAEIIANKLGVSFEKKEILYPNRDNYKAIFELIKSCFNTVDILILVTHLEYVDFLPYDFVREELDFKPGYPFNTSVNKGGYRHISLTQKTITTKNP